MPYFDYFGDFDVSVDEFLSACNKRDINDIITALREDGHLKNELEISKMSIPEQLFEEQLVKLHGKWALLTKEEEEMIVNISKRF